MLSPSHDSAGPYRLWIGLQHQKIGAQQSGDAPSAWGLALKLMVAASHLYPGCRLSLDEDGGEAALVAFGDGVVVLGGCTLRDGEAHLDLPAYETARGAAIPPKRWVLRRRDGDGLWTVKGRAG